MGRTVESYRESRLRYRNVSIIIKGERTLSASNKVTECIQEARENLGVSKDEFNKRLRENGDLVMVICTDRFLRKWEETKDENLPHIFNSRKDLCLESEL